MQLTWISWAIKCLPLVSLLFGVGCEDPPRSEARLAISAVCAGGANSRWTPAGEPYQLTSRYAPSGSFYIEEVGGIVTDSGSVYVLDAAQSRVFILDLNLQYRRSFGKKGNGPGELAPERDQGRRGINWRWIDVSSDTLAVFDGHRVHLFTTDGAFVETLTEVGRTLSAESPRIAFDGGQLLYASGGYDALLSSFQPGRYDWHMIRRSRRAEERITSLHLVPLPVSQQGVPFWGPEQAVPLWDNSVECVTISDGAGEWLIRSSVNGGTTDTLQVQLPQISVGQSSRKEIEALLGKAGGGGGYRDPTLTRKISGLVVDPDGVVWLLPVQENRHAGDVRVLFVQPASGTVTEARMPAFPAAFGAPGTYYAEGVNQETGEPEIVRYDIIPALNGSDQGQSRSLRSRPATSSQNRP